MTALLSTGHPRRLGTSSFLPDLSRRARDSNRRHLSGVAVVRSIRCPAERRAHLCGYASARLPQSAHICVGWGGIQRHHDWERPRMRNAWVQC